ncbi:hypothetical protein C8J56DRAFT_9508 [Mycena floridula]|nr:hypothetical protein C8J56DRAFT_9508 [Mycena floridula]
MDIELAEAYDENLAQSQILRWREPEVSRQHLSRLAILLFVDNVLSEVRDSWYAEDVDSDDYFVPTSILLPGFNLSGSPISWNRFTDCLSAMELEPMTSLGRPSKLFKSAIEREALSSTPSASASSRHQSPFHLSPNHSAPTAGQEASPAMSAFSTWSFHPAAHRQTASFAFDSQLQSNLSSFSARSLVVFHWSLNSFTSRQSCSRLSSPRNHQNSFDDIDGTASNYFDLYIRCGISPEQAARNG